jgi:TIR domain-containing protein
MKLFVSWSGSRSKAIADALRRWIPDIIQTVEPWMSDSDIEAGARWNREMENQLRETQYGIICLTKENQTAPWILFETGAIAKAIVGTFVCPYLIDLEPAEVAQGPLTQFQAKRANEKETWELMCAINHALAESRLPEDRLRRTFERCWPDLHNALGDLPPASVLKGSSRSVENMIDEVVELTRGLSRSGIPESWVGKLNDDITYIRGALTSLLAQSQIDRTHVDDADISPTSRRGKTKWMQISVEFPTSTESKSRTIRISSTDCVSDVLDSVFSLLHEYSDFHPEPYTHLWDWILIRKRDGLPLLLRAVHTLIPAKNLFMDGELWEVIPLDEPLLYKAERFGIERGRATKW